MTRKLLFLLAGFVLAAVVFSMAIDIPVFAQEQSSEDIADISLDELLNVKITTAGKKAEKISEIPASVVLITREDIKRYGYASLDEILENVPGVYKLNDMSYYGTTFGMRGFLSLAPRNIIVLVNGVHQMDGYWKTSEIQNFTIPVEAIDRIEVVRGPMSVIYGSGAFFGAINIITNEKVSDKSANSISASGGSLETAIASLKVAGTKDDFNYSVTAGFHTTQGPDVALSKMATSIPDYMGINETNNTTKDRLKGSEKYFNLTTEYRGLYAKMSYSESIDQNYIIWPSVSRGNLTNVSHAVFSVGYKKDFSQKFSLDGSVTYHKNSWWLDYDLMSTDVFGYESGKSEEAELDLTINYQPSDKVSITSGLHYQKVMGVVGFDWIPFFPYNIDYDLDGTSIKTPSFFTQIEVNPFKKFRLVGGIRFEKMDKYSLKGLVLGDLNVDTIITGTYDNDKIQVVPRVAAIFSLNEKNYVKFLYGKAIRHPEFQPNMENIIYDGPTLVPEYINTLELNYISTPSSNITLNFSLFYNRLQNLIVRTFETDATGGFRSFYANEGKLETVGGELTIQAKPAKNFFLELSGTYQKTKDKRPGFEDIDVSYSPDWLGHLKASFRFVKNASIAVTGRYVGSMLPRWDPLIDNGDGTFGNRIGKAVDEYFIFDGNLRIDNIFISGLYLNFRCLNLFNKDYIYPANENNTWADIGTIGRGLSRAFIITLGKEF